MTECHESWRDLAACKDTPIEWFFPAKAQGGRAWNGDPYANARRVCAGCQVRSACFLDSIGDPSVRMADGHNRGNGGAGGGFRAGLTARERDKKRRALHLKRRRAQPEPREGVT